jgi:hypothetical protein
VVSPGSDALGRYELLLELARGGMAELFLARLHGAGGFAKLIAIKRILPHLVSDRQFTDMFLQEGRIAAHLSHPNVCQVFELGEIDGQLFLAMEYLDGVAWSELAAAGRPSPRLVVGVLAQAAEGLQYAHALRDPTGAPTRVIHRDVSPQNLFVTVDGICKVLDFGVSKMATDGPRTRSGVVKGKLPYMSPEQIRGEPLDGRSDVFALGVCAWEALAGARLFDRTTDFLIWKAITEEAIPRLGSVWRECPPAVDALVARALSRTVTDRPTAQGFADELRGLCGFASASEIADAVRTTCATRLAERQQRVAQALAARPLPASAPQVVVEDAGATLDLVSKARAQAEADASMRLRDRSVVVERATAPVVVEHATAPAPAGPPTTSAVAQSPAGARSRTWLIALAAAAIATAITLVVVFATRGGSATPPADAADRVEDRGSSDLDHAVDRFNNGIKKLEKLRELEKLRDLGNWGGGSGSSGSAGSDE